MVQVLSRKLLLQLDNQPELWREQLAMVEAAQTRGLDIRGQVLSRPVGMMMGMWFCASAAGNYVAGLIARATASEEMAGEEVIFSLNQKAAFIDVYTSVGLIALTVGFILAMLSPLLKKGMHGIN